MSEQPRAKFDGAGVAALVKLALAEDLGLSDITGDITGDVTSEATIAADLQGEAVLLTRESLRVCGFDVVAAVCRGVSKELHFVPLVAEGSDVPENTHLAKITGPVKAILIAERTALNFLQRLSGIATQTAKLVKIIEGTGAQLLDTRKTTPGFRVLEKYAVATGGAKNHRSGLFDMFLIKNNHVDALAKSQQGDIGEAIRRCRAYAKQLGREIKLEVEVRNETELRAALAENPDIVLLDNMSPAELRQAVALREALGLREKVLLEASGGIKADNVRQYAETGVDYLSMGALTHSVRAADISLRIAF